MRSFNNAKPVSVHGYDFAVPAYDDVSSAVLREYVRPVVESSEDGVPGAVSLGNLRRADVGERDAECGNDGVGAVREVQNEGDAGTGKGGNVTGEGAGAVVHDAEVGDSGLTSAEGGLEGGENGGVGGNGGGGNEMQRGGAAVAGGFGQSGVGACVGGSDGGEVTRVRLPVKRGQQMRELQVQAAARIEPDGMARRLKMGWTGLRGLTAREERGEPGR